MNDNLFQGKLVRLVAENPDTIAEALALWSQDSEYSRLLASDPSNLYSTRKIKEFVEKELAEEKPDLFYFMIRTLADNRLIGDISLDGVQWQAGDAFVGIGLGERDYWGRGYGSDAMELILRFAFEELNLHRLSLNVFEYNPRAIGAYQKVGFQVEGRARQFLNREGQRWDMIYMGILRDEWEKRRAAESDQKGGASQ